MLNKQQQIKNGFIYFLPVVIGNLIPIITLPIFTRILTKEDFGALALAQAYAFFITGIANFGLPIVYERNFFGSKGRGEGASLLYSTLLFVLCTFGVSGALTWVLSDRLSLWIIGDARHASLLGWSFLAAGIMSLKVYFLTYFKNTENAKSYAAYTIDENLIAFVLSLLFVVVLRTGVKGIPFGQIIAGTIVFLLLCRRFVRELPVAFSRPLLKESLKISYPLTPRIFFGVIGTQFDKYMIGLLSTLGGVGIYSIGQKIANVVFVYMTALQNVFSPQVYRRMFGEGPEGGKAIGRYLTPFAYASTVLALLVLLFSEEAVLLLTPESYHGAIPIVMILSLYMGLLFFGKQPQILYAKKTAVTSLMTLVSIGLNVAINIPFIRLWGAIGAAWGTLTAGLVTGVISFVVAQHYYRIGWEYGKIGLIYLFPVAALIGLILLRSVEVPYIMRLVVKLGLLGGYVLLGYRLGIVTTANLLLVRNLLPKSLGFKPLPT